MSPTRYFISALVLSLALIAAPALAQETVITADKMEQHGPILMGEGNVVIESEGGTLKAGRIRYDTATRDINADDGVYFEDEKAKITASKAELNLERQTGVLYDADVLFKEHSYRVFGSRIEKRGERSYFLEEGSLTTCTGPVPDWCVKGHNVDLEVGNRIKSTNATFRVRNVPVLYTPYFWAPVVVERRTGLLFPELGYSSSKGFTWRQPFFWAISENRDATIFTDLYTKRGLGFGAEYRYIEAPGVKGNMNFFHIRDNDLDRSFRELRAEHRHKWKNLRGFYDVAYVNQKDFYREYEPYLVQSARRFLESQGEVALHTPHAKLYADARYVRELQDAQDQKLVVQKLPEAGVFLKPHTLGPLVVTAETSAANFEVGRGTDGQRYQAGVTLESSIGTGPTFAQSLGLGFVYYALNDPPATQDNDFHRGSLDYTAELRTSLARRYERFEHIVMPALSYHVRHFEHGVDWLFDSEELLGDADEAELSITNRFRDSRGEFLTLRVSEAYDFHVGDDHLGPVNLDLNLNRGVTLSFGLSYDVHRRIITESRSGFGFTHKKLTVSGGHTFTKGDITMYNLSLDFKATPSTTLKSQAWYDSTGGNLERLSLGVIYDSQCWKLSVDYTKRHGEHIVFFTITLKGLGDVIRVGQG
jgi:LPS-assembly protein